MSYSFDQAKMILEYSTRWEFDDENNKYVIYLKPENDYWIAHLKRDGEKWYITDTIDNSVWFRSYASAKLYIKNEWYVDGRFKKVRGDDINGNWS